MNLFSLDQSFCSAIALALFHVAWLGVAIGMVAFTSNGLLRKASANCRYWINFGALIVLVACLPITFVLAQNAGDQERPVAFVSPESGNASAFDRETQRSAVNTEDIEDAYEPSSDSRLSGSNVIAETMSADATTPRTGNFLTPWAAKLVAAIYLFGVSVMLFRLAIAIRSSQNIRRSSSFVVDENLHERVQAIARSLAIRISPAIATCESVAVPVLVGVVKPTILVPAAMLNGLSLEQLEHAIRHEMAHLKRFDHVAIIAQRIFEAVLFFHPVVWYLSRRIHDERECSCDDVVIESGTDRIQYANSLLRVAEFKVTNRQSAIENVAVAADGHQPSKLRRRISRLLNEVPAARTTAGSRPLSFVLILVAVGAVWASGQLTLASSDQTKVTKQDQEPEPAATKNNDTKKELVDAVKRSREIFSSIKTGHIEFERFLATREFDPRITLEDCERLLKGLDLAKHPENLGQFRKAIALDPAAVKNANHWGEHELHFDGNRVRTSTVYVKRRGPDIHITDQKHSILWDAANYQMNIQPIRENSRFQFKLRSFIHPLPFDDVDGLDAVQVRKVSSDFLLVTDGLIKGPGGVGGAIDSNGHELQIDGSTGFETEQHSFSRGTEDHHYRMNWRSYPNGIKFPGFIAEFVFREGKLAKFEFMRVKQARFNIDIPDSVFVMSAPAGASIFDDVNGKISSDIPEDVFDVMSLEERKKASGRVKPEHTPEALRGIEQVKKLYRVDEGQALRRLGPPFPLARKYVPNMLGDHPSRRPGQPSWILKQHDSKFEPVFIHTNGSFDLKTIAQKLFSRHPAEIDGDEDLLGMQLEGDFIFRKSSTPTQRRKDLARILQQELQTDITVEVREIETPVYVVNGELKLNLRPNKTRVEVNGGEYKGLKGEIIHRGNLKTFLADLSEYINIELENETIPSELKFKWSKRWYDGGIPNNRPENGFDLQADKVLEIVSEQTGLEFHKETRPKKMLIIERTKK